MEKPKSLSEELKYPIFVDMVLKLDQEDENFEKENEHLFYEYARYIYQQIRNKPIEERVTVLYFFHNNLPLINNLMLQSKDESILRAMLVLEKLKNNNAMDIRDDVERVIFQNRLEQDALARKYNRRRNPKQGENKYRRLSEYLNNKDPDTISKEMDEDLENFAKALPNIQDRLFSLYRDGTDISRNDIINNLFINTNISLETLNTVYSEVLLKSNYLKAFDYQLLLLESDDLMTKIKGLYRKCDSQIFSLFEQLDRTDAEYYLESIVEINKDDENGLIWFFKELNKNIENQEFKDFINSKYSNYLNSEISYKEDVQKLLDRSKNINIDMLEEIGSSKEFVDNYYQLLDNFMTSNDKEYQSILLLPLAIGLIEIQKEKYGLDFKIVCTSKNITDTSFGSYDKDSKELYINPNVLKRFKNNKEALASTIDTVFHETRHAIQNKTLIESHEISYDNLLMAIDSVMCDNVFTSYYMENYAHISFERDARNLSYVDTMTFFDKYPEMQQYVKKEFNYNYVLSDFLRKDPFLDLENYNGIIDLFINEVNNNIEVLSDDERLIDDYLERVFRFPVVKEFFIINENKRIEARSDEYFDNKLRELESMEDTLEKKEAIYSIKSFRYAQEVGKYLSSIIPADEYSSGIYSEKIIGEVIDNVGQKPSR